MASQPTTEFFLLQMDGNILLRQANDDESVTSREASTCASEPTTEQRT
jgi:hypothetical protein